MINRIVAACVAVFVVAVAIFYWNSPSGKGAKANQPLQGAPMPADKVGLPIIKTDKVAGLDNLGISQNSDAEEGSPAARLNGWDTELISSTRSPRFLRVQKETVADMATEAAEKIKGFKSLDQKKKSQILGPQPEAEELWKSIRTHVVASDPTTIGIRHHVYATTENRYWYDAASLWFDRKKSTIRSVEDLFTSKNALKHVAWAVKTRNDEDNKSAPDIAFNEAKKYLRGAYFGSDGEFIVPLAMDDTLKRTQYGEVMYFPKEDLDPLLSDFGRRAQKAAGNVKDTAGGSEEIAAKPLDLKSLPTAKPANTYNAEGEFVGRKVRGINCMKEKCVALTINSGLGPNTEKLLDVLESKNAPATFFVQGSVAENFPQTVKRMDRQGHQIGNHTWSHKTLTRLSPDKVKEQFDKTDKTLESIVGYKPTMYRPPYAARTSKIDEIAGRPAVMWYVDSNDWKNKTEEKLVKAVEKGAHSGATILLHDIYGTTVDAMPAIVDMLQAKGLTLVTVDMLMAGRQVNDTDVIKTGPALK